MFPSGGGVAFGKRREIALRRKLGEELDFAPEELVEVGNIENRFECDGAPGHEFNFVYAASAVGAPQTQLEAHSVVEDIGLSNPARWLTLEELKGGPDAVYSVGVLPFVCASLMRFPD